MKMLNKCLEIPGWLVRLLVEVVMFGRENVIGFHSQATQPKPVLEVLWSFRRAHPSTHRLYRAIWRGDWYTGSVAASGLPTRFGVLECPVDTQLLLQEATGTLPFQHNHSPAVGVATFQRMIARWTTSCSASAGQSHISVSDLVSKTKYCFKPTAKAQQAQGGTLVSWITLATRLTGRTDKRWRIGVVIGKRYRGRSRP